jgi:hypothetical protein
MAELLLQCINNRIRIRAIMGLLQVNIIDDMIWYIWILNFNFVII